MISRLRTLFSQASDAFATTDIDSRDEQQLAAAALLVEVATIDRQFDDTERQRIIEFVRSRFSLSDAEADALIGAAQSAVEQSTQLYAFTTAIKNGFSYEERVALMESL